MPTRDDAYQFMISHVKNENLQKHMLAQPFPSPL